jgi:hypothetical protein
MERLSVEAIARDGNREVFVTVLTVLTLQGVQHKL